MNLFNPILRLFGIGSLSNPDKGYQVGAVQKTSTASGIAVSDERALKISGVWACTQLISNSAAGMPLLVFRETENGREPLKSRHFLTDLLHKRPNNWMKPRDFRLAMTAQMALWNNAYAEIVYSGERPVALIPLRPGRMTPFITNDGELTYHYSVDSGIKVYSQRSIFHLKGFGTDGIVGAERNNYARESYGLSVAAETYAAKQFASGRPGGVINFDKFLTVEQREQARQLYRGISEGPINSNELWVLEGGSTYNPIDYNPDQMQMIATRAHQLSDVARYFNMPDVLIGAGANGNSAWPASFEQQMLMFLTHTIQPYLDEWESAIRYALIPFGSDINVDHDPSPLVKMDSQAKASFLSTLVQNGLMTRNEARETLNLKEVDGGDDLTVQVNLTTLNNMESTPNAAPESDTSQPL
jgi:HK97 family phage portal protein